MKLIDIINPNRTPDSEFEYLENRIREGTAVTYPIEMPECCDPGGAKITFTYAGGCYCVKLSKHVLHSTENEALADLCSGSPIQFDSAQAMRDFFRSIRLTTTPEKIKIKMPQTERGNLNLQRDEPVQRLDPQQLFADMTETIRGQDEAVRCIVRYACASAAKRNPQRPPSIVLVGGTGQGKTLAGKTLAQAMNCQIKDPNRQYGTIVVHCNELTENHDVSRLIGGSPNYVGYGDENVLSPLIANPYQVIVFDEIEKAAPRVLDVLMGALDSGEIMMSKPTDGKNMLDFRHSILLFTSNLRMNNATSSKKIGFESDSANTVHGDMSVCYRETMVSQGMRREIVARFSDVVYFRPLLAETVIDIILLEIQKCAEEYGFDINYVDPGILQSLYDDVQISGFGARMIRRIVSNRFDLLFATQTVGSYDLTGSIDDPVLTLSV